MGDDRASVYRIEPGHDMWVYRASAVGGCERALIAARSELDRVPPPASLQVKFDEGHAAEHAIMTRFAKDHPGFAIDIPESDDDQIEVELERTIRWGDHYQETQVIIRGHLDGLAVDPATGFAVVVDAKAFGPSFWKQLQSKGIKAFPYYLSQMAVYMAATGAQSAVLPVALKSEDGTVGPDNEVEYHWLTLEDVDIESVFDKIRRVERAVGLGETQAEWPDCPPSSLWGCGYPQVHDPVEYAGMEDPADQAVFIKAALLLDNAKLFEQQAKTAKAEAKELTQQLVSKHGKRLQYDGQTLVWVRSQIELSTRTVKAHVREFPKLGRRKIAAGTGEADDWAGTGTGV